MESELQRMKYLLYLLILIPTLAIAQTQVSDISYNLPRDDYTKKGFMKIGEDEYFLERSLSGTKVSLVTVDSLEYIHELKFRPTDSNYNTPVSLSAKDNNSGFYYEGEVLYDIYWEYIYLTNIITGELVEIINLKDHGLKLQKDFDMGDNYFFFKSLNGFGYVRLDRNTGQVDILDDTGIIQNGRRYSVPSLSNTIQYHDLETNQYLEHPHQFNSIESIIVDDSNPNSSLIIKDGNGIHLLLHDDSIKTLNCSSSSESQIWYATDSTLAYSMDSGSSTHLYIVDMATCTQLQKIEIKNPYSYPSSELFVVYTDQQLFDEYFIYGTTNDWQGNGEFFLYDIANDKIAPLEIPVDHIRVDRSVRYGNNYSFLSSNHLHKIGTLPELYRLDLKTYSIERISNLEPYQATSILIGELQSDQEINAYYRWDDTAAVFQIDDQQETLEQVKEYDLYSKIGIYPRVYRDIWVGEKYFFSTIEAIYVMEDNETSKILDLAPSKGYTSEFVAMDDQVFVLAALDTADYALKIDASDLSYSKTVIDGVQKIAFSHTPTTNAIVNSGNYFSDNNRLGFFDTVAEEYVSYADLGLPTGTPESVSGNHILYRSSSSNDYERYLINTLTRSITLTEIQEYIWPDIFPDQMGGFYLNDTKFDDEVSLKYLDPQGNLTNLFTDFNYEVWGLSGIQSKENVLLLAFNGETDLITIVIKDGIAYQKIISGDTQLYPTHLEWDDAKNSGLIEVRKGTVYDTYTFTLESESKKITPISREDQIVLVLPEDGPSSIFVYESDNNQLTFERHNFPDGTTELVTEFQCLDNPSLCDKQLKIGDNKYLLRFNDGLTGEEPWTYDTSNGELIQLNDLYEGLISSTINDYTRNPTNGDAYFSARKTQGDRQLFTLEYELSSSSTDIDEEHSSLTALPNPTSDYLRLDKDYQSVNIYNLDGRLITHQEGYQSIDHT